MPPLSADARLTSICLTTVAYIGPKSRTERQAKVDYNWHRVAHVTHDWDTTFKVKKVTGQPAGAGAYCGASCTACVT